MLIFRALQWLSINIKADSILSVHFFFVYYPEITDVSLFIADQILGCNVAPPASMSVAALIVEFPTMSFVMLSKDNAQ
jgi:hypothetical protein